MTNRLGTFIDRRSHAGREGFVYVSSVAETEAPLSKTGVWITRLVLLVLVAAIVAAIVLFLA